MLSDEAPHHAVNERRQVEPEQVLRPQQRRCPTGPRRECAADDAGVGEARQQQRIGPDQDADGHAGDGAARGGAPPDQAAEERRRELRDGGERQDADGGELRVAGRCGNTCRRAAGWRRSRARRTVSSSAPTSLAAGDQRARAAAAPAASTMSFDTMIASATDFDDHHGGRGRQPADEGDDREQFGAGLQRQRQHEHVAVDAAGGERQQARRSRSAPRTG